MAAYYSKTGKSPLSPFLLPSIFITFYLLLFSSTNMTSVGATSFDFTQFKSDEEQLIFQGDATVNDEIRCLVLTREEAGGPAVKNSVGRVLYETPILLFNTENRHEASFKTSFTFLIYRYSHYSGSSEGSDGLAFFLAPFNSKPKKVDSGLLGIFSDKPSLLQSSEDELVVAVEFDTYSNTWDPKDPHIGIDVHSITSSL